MIRLLGRSHYTADGRSYCIETCEMLPLAGIYDVMLFEIRRGSQVFNLGVAFPNDISGQMTSIGLRFERTPTEIVMLLLAVRLPESTAVMVTS